MTTSTTCISRNEERTTWDLYDLFTLENINIDAISKSVSEKVRFSISPTSPRLIQDIENPPHSIFTTKYTGKRGVEYCRHGCLVLRARNRVFFEYNDAPSISCDYSELGTGYTFIAANRMGLILSRDHTVVLVNTRLRQAVEIEFDWNPYRASFTGNHFIVGTRKKPEGPSRIWCLSSDMRVKWIMKSKMKIVGMGSMPIEKHYVQPYYPLRIDTNTDVFCFNDTDLICFIDTRRPSGHAVLLRSIENRSYLMESERKARKANKLGRLARWSKGYLSDLIGTISSVSTDQFSRAILSAPSLVGICTAKTSNKCIIAHDYSSIVLSIWDNKGEMELVSRLPETLSTTIRPYFGKFREGYILSYTDGSTYIFDKSLNIIQDLSLPSGIDQLLRIDRQNSLILLRDKWAYLLDIDYATIRLFPIGKDVKLYQTDSKIVYNDEYVWYANRNNILAGLTSRVRIEDKADTQVSIAELAEYENPNEAGNVLYAGIDSSSHRIFLAYYANMKPHLICMDYQFRRKWARVYDRYSLIMGMNVHDRHGIITIAVADRSREDRPIPQKYILMVDLQGRMRREIRSDNVSTVMALYDNETDEFPGNRNTGTIHPAILRKVGNEWKVEYHRRDRMYGNRLRDAMIGPYSVRMIGRYIYVITAHGHRIQYSTSAYIYGGLHLEASDRLVFVVGKTKLECISNSGESLWEQRVREKIRNITKFGESVLCTSNKRIMLFAADGNMIWEGDGVFADRYNKVECSVEEGRIIWITSNGESLYLGIYDHMGSILSYSEIKGYSSADVTPGLDYILAKSSSGCKLFKIG